ncbi:MAG: M23 family metallopeptidase [Smithellaceae bacterium]|nr:M23 family metallopeptidase [Smithellaceae bacterium]NLX51732.1 peptidoglycan DD-metalloendopeptidase family protein [Deltaproteobacteria bacterium]
MKRIGAYVAIVVFVLMAGAVVWLYFAGYLDRGKPGITLKEEISAIGRKKDIDLTLSDATSGLARVKIEIFQDRQTRLVAAESFPRGVRQKDLRVSVDTEALKLKNGPASLTITAGDHSLFANETVWSQQITIDTLPPQIAILNPVNYLNQGGTGFIAYRTSKPSALTGVYVDRRFFAGHTIALAGRPTTVAYFAVPPDAVNGKTRIAVFARDAAGNEAQTTLPCTIKPKKFRSDKVDLSNSFLQKIVPDFQSSTPQLSGKTPVEVFGYVNSTLRDENTRTIQAVCARTAPARLWDGAFHRMRNAKPMALFGDQRTYLVDGKPFGNSVHLGIDLASVAHAPIEAANAGVVIFAGPLGIYGNAVIIDHGLGLSSLYGHLSVIETAVGKNVKREEKIGLSGLTGLAGGDHLHFSMLVGGEFVNPQEWWDPHWIEDNVMKKMQI